MAKGIRLLVCGGRKYFDRKRIFRELDELHKRTPVATVIHGGAIGADQLGGIWANKNKIPTVVFHANWEKHGRAAGTKRNQEMLTIGVPNLVIAFPGGRGTADMVRRSVKAGLMVIEIGEADAPTGV